MLFNLHAVRNYIFCLLMFLRIPQGILLFCDSLSKVRIPAKVAIKFYTAYIVENLSMLDGVYAVADVLELQSEPSRGHIN